MHVMLAENKSLIKKQNIIPLGVVGRASCLRGWNRVGVAGVYDTNRFW